MSHWHRLAQMFALLLTVGGVVASQSQAAVTHVTVNQILATDSLADSGYNGGNYDMVLPSLTMRFQSGTWLDTAPFFAFKEATANYETLAAKSAGAGIAQWIGTGSGYATAVTPGAAINAGSAWDTWAGTDSNYTSYAYYQGVEYASMQGTTNAIAGFRFSADGGSNWNYGWARISVADLLPYGSTTYQLTVHDWAFETIANTAINAGDTGVIPEPASLSLLVFGSLMLGLRRRLA